MAKHRGLAGEHGYTVERGPVRDTWILTCERTGKPLVGPRRRTAFNVKFTIALLAQLADE
jgi:hypothetical protein